MEKTSQHYESVVPAKDYAQTQQTHHVGQVTMQDHYTMLSPQPRTVATKWGLMEDVERFNALKYIARAAYKGSFHQDLAKAADWLMWRLQRDGCTSLLIDLRNAAARYSAMTGPVSLKDAIAGEVDGDNSLPTL